MTAPSSPLPAPAPVDHYENFPVASWLCPPALRPAVAAIYWFARTADDLADEGEAPPDQRLADLGSYRADLAAVAAGHPPSARWAKVFQPLAATIAAHHLPVGPLSDLLSAFEQDVCRTRDGQGYADRAELVDYCRRSANPVGRLVLHLYGLSDARALAESDCICTALQLINFWQDLSIDLPRRRYYLPASDLVAHGMDPQRPQSWAAHPGASALVASQAAWAKSTMLEGLQLPLRIPGRAGWELRAVAQGGLRVLDKVAAQGADAFTRRPKLSAADGPLLLWRCLRMGQSRASATP